MAGRIKVNQSGSFLKDKPSPTELTIEILEREDRIIIENLNGLYEDCLDDLKELLSAGEKKQ